VYCRGLIGKEGWRAPAYLARKNKCYQSRPSTGAIAALLEKNRFRFWNAPRGKSFHNVASSYDGSYNGAVVAVNGNPE